MKPNLYTLCYHENQFLLLPRNIPLALTSIPYPTPDLLLTLLLTARRIQMIQSHPPGHPVSLPVTPPTNHAANHPQSPITPYNPDRDKSLKTNIKAKELKSVNYRATAIESAREDELEFDPSMDAGKL